MTEQELKDFDIWLAENADKPGYKEMIDVGTRLHNHLQAMLLRAEWHQRRNVLLNERK